MIESIEIEIKNKKFKLLSYQDLQLKTCLLFNNYKNEHQCYVAPEYSVLRERVLGSENCPGLRKNYEERVKKKDVSMLMSFLVSNKPSNYRIDQADLIIKVCKSLPEKTDNFTMAEYYHRILIMILGYRYLRLLGDYDNDPKEARTRCGLFASIEDILDLNPENNNTNALDSYTIETHACDLKFFIEKNKQNYAYVMKDSKFFVKLTDIIEHAKKKNALTRIHSDVAYIRFIESMSRLLTSVSSQAMQSLKILEQFCSQLDVYSIENIDLKWQMMLKQELENINKKYLEWNNLLQYKKITPVVFHHEIQKIKCYELTLSICTDAFKRLDSIKSQKFENFAKFQEFMFRALESKYRYVLFGAYSFILTQVPKEGKLRDTIAGLLGIHVDNQPDFENEDMGLTALNDLIQLKDSQHKPCVEKLLQVYFVKPFGLFQQKLTQVLNTLTKRHHQSHVNELFLEMNSHH